MTPIDQNNIEKKSSLSVIKVELFALHLRQLDKKPTLSKENAQCNMGCTYINQPVFFHSKPYTFITLFAWMQQAKEKRAPNWRVRRQETGTSVSDGASRINFPRARNTVRLGNGVKWGLTVPVGDDVWSVL